MHKRTQKQGKLTPARHHLENAKLEAVNGPEGEVGAAAVSSNWAEPGNLCQVVIHLANVAYFGAGGVGDKHADEKHDENDHCITAHTCHRLVIHLATATFQWSWSQ